MNERNAFFACVFSRELDKWKSETNQTQERFAEITNIHKNSVSKYKKGEAFPTPPTMTAICEVLGVEESIFYPHTTDELVKYSKDFRDAILAEEMRESSNNLKAVGISQNFLDHVLSLSNIDTIFPFDNNKVPGELTFAWITADNQHKLTNFTCKDLSIIKEIQDKADEFILALLLKAKYDMNT